MRAYKLNFWSSGLHIIADRYYLDKDVALSEAKKVITADGDEAVESGCLSIGVIFTPKTNNNWAQTKSVVSIIDIIE